MSTISRSDNNIAGGGMVGSLLKFGGPYVLGVAVVIALYHGLIRPIEDSNNKRLDKEAAIYKDIATITGNLRGVAESLERQRVNR